MLTQYLFPAVWIYTEKQAYATREDIQFLAMTEDPHPLEFDWHFGDQRAVRTPSRTFITKYLHPDRYTDTLVYIRYDELEYVGLLKRGCDDLDKHNAKPVSNISL